MRPGRPAALAVAAALLRGAAASCASATASLRASDGFSPARELFIDSNAACLAAAVNSSTSDACLSGVRAFQDACEHYSGFVCEQAVVLRGEEGGDDDFAYSTAICVAGACGSDDLQAMADADPPCLAGYECSYSMQCYPPMSLQDGMLLLMAVGCVLAACLFCGRCCAQGRRDADGGDRDRARGPTVVIEYGRASARRDRRRGRGRRGRRYEPAPAPAAPPGFFERWFGGEPAAAGATGPRRQRVELVVRGPGDPFEAWLRRTLVVGPPGPGSGSSDSDSDSGADPEAVRLAIAELPQCRAGEAHAGRECAICIEPLQEGELVRDLACSHSFHVACIDEWLDISGVCPLCKREVL